MWTVIWLLFAIQLLLDIFAASVIWGLVKSGLVHWDAIRSLAKVTNMSIREFEVALGVYPRGPHE